MSSPPPHTSRLHKPPPPPSTAPIPHSPPSSSGHHRHKPTAYHIPSRGCSALWLLAACLGLLQAGLWTTHKTDAAAAAAHCSSETLDPIWVTTAVGEKSSQLGRGGLQCLEQLRISFSAFGQNFSLHLSRNNQLDSRTGGSPSSQRRPDHVFVSAREYLEKQRDHCHYLAYTQSPAHNLKAPDGAISIVNHCSLSGFFHFNTDHHHHQEHTFYLHSNSEQPSDPQPGTTIHRHNGECDTNYPRQWVAAASLPQFESFIDGLPEEDEKHLQAALRRTKRAANRSPPKSIKQEPYRSNPDSLYVELLIVHDNTQYMEAHGNKGLLIERSMQIANIMNAFYMQLNVFITLVGVVLWVEKDEIELLQDGDATLTNFLRYRYNKLLPLYPHDNAQLITARSFNGSVVGKALKGPICTHDDSGGVNTHHSNLTTTIAVTIAHELGHNFGMAHDNDTCKCPDDKCIMSASSSSVIPIHWSSCSISHLEESRKSGLLDCLRDKPRRVFGPICGNGFVEEGEDCDLGEMVTIVKGRKALAKCTPGKNCEPSTSISVINKCCDRRTCRFAANASCAQGACCDVATCQVYSSDEPRVCRSRRGECDLDEFCDGTSEICPPDVYHHDGIECNGDLGDGTATDPGSNRTRAYCYQGKCGSHQSQCSLLWGPTAFVSDDICYEQNVHGNMSGNCGYERRNKTYHTCSQQDTLCGMLFCDHKQPGDPRKTGKLHYGFESASILTMSLFDSLKVNCRAALVDSGPDARDPGLVPNGAACGDDRMCIQQVCTPLHQVLARDWCPSDCNGNGICDNTGICHCNDGTTGSSCHQIFGLSTRLTFVIYMIMFFIPLIALIVVVLNTYREKLKLWWFLYNRKNVLMARGNQKRRLGGYRAPNGAAKTTISQPIPIIQPDNLARSFQELMVDPWKELPVSAQPTPKPGVTFVGADYDAPTSSSAKKLKRTNQKLKPVRSAPPPPTTEKSEQMV